LIGHDLSMRILYRFHRWLIFARVIALYISWFQHSLHSFMSLHHVKSHYYLILYYTSTYVERVGVSQQDNACSFIFFTLVYTRWPSWSYGSWIYNYLCMHCLSPLTLWIRIPLRWGVPDTTLCDKVCQWVTAGQRFSPGTTNKTNRHDIAEILLKVTLNTINLSLSHDS